MMLKKVMTRVVLSAVAIATLGVSVPQAHSQDRAYVMLMAERKFGATPHVYVALGQDRKSGEWNLPGGKKDPGDRTRGAAAARELSEETGGVINKIGDVPFWTGRPSYEHGRHKVFLITPGEINFQIGQIDAAVKRNVAQPNLPYQLREMKAYEFIKLDDLVHLANNQVNNGQSMTYNHPQQGNMVVDGWMLYTLKQSNAGNGVLRNYRY